MTRDNLSDQFPDFDKATLPPIPEAWTDQSWAEEQCPAFNTADGRFAVWVDYADAAAREFPESKRFTAKALDDGGGLAEGGPVINTDDWSELLAFVLGDGFAAVLRQWLDADEIAMVRSRNATPEYSEGGSCASHDFCDANMAMDAAFKKVLGRNSDIEDLPDGSESPDIALWNAAWPIGLAALVGEAPSPTPPQIISVVVYAGWPSADGSHWLDVDGEGGMWSPGFVAAFEVGDFTEDQMRAAILGRLNAKYGDGWPEGGVPPLTWTLDHFDAEPTERSKVPFIQAQWEPVAVEKLAP